MYTEYKEKTIEDGLLKKEDVALYNMDLLDKGSERNFDNLIDMLTKREGENKSPLIFRVYKLASLANHFGINPERTIELIQLRLGVRLALGNKSDWEEFDKNVNSLVTEVYSRWSNLHGAWQTEYNLIEYTSLIPSFVYDLLPPFLKVLTHHFSSNRERDVFLLSSLVVLSACFPSVKGSYDNRLVSSTLFLLVCAPASAGKGVMNWARKLGEEIHKHIESLYREALEEYNAELKIYNDAIANGEKAEKPKKPERPLFYLPANSTTSKLIQTLAANIMYAYSAIMMESEADTLITALKSQHGNFSDIIRKSYHHEPLELLRKTNDEYIYIEKSYLSVALSGTPSQIKNLVTSVENGFFSRFLFYDFPIELKWKDVFRRSLEAPEGVFYSMSVRLLQYTKKIDGRAIEFRLTEGQENGFNMWFSEKQEHIHNIYGDQLIASVRRLGLTAFRISMILTILRYESLDAPEIIYCSDEDFNISMCISNTCFEHTINIFNQLKGLKDYNTAKDKKEAFYEKLPDKFNRSVYIDTALGLNIKDKAAEYYITGFITSGLLKRVEHNHYQKI